MKIEELIPIVYQGERVLTGKQIAELYNVSDKRIKDNFHTLRKHFKEGIHFHKVEGEELHALKEQVLDSLKPFEVSPLKTFSRSAILYTAQGVFLHAKSLNSPKAFELFNAVGAKVTQPLLEEIIFGIKNTPTVEDKAQVYAFGMNDNTVKIGASSVVARRTKEVEYLSGFKVVRTYQSIPLPREVAFELESRCHKAFESERVHGEFFSVAFREASEMIEFLVDEKLSELRFKEKTNKSLTLPDVNLVDKFLDIAAQIQDATTKDKILTHAANLLVGHQHF